MESIKDFGTHFAIRLRFTGFCLLIVSGMLIERNDWLEISNAPSFYAQTMSRTSHIALHVEISIAPIFSE